MTSADQLHAAFVEGRQRPSLLATESSELPSAEELGKEFEEFLRGVDEQDESDLPDVRGES